MNMDDRDRKRMLDEIAQAVEAAMATCPHCGVRMPKRMRRCGNCKVKAKIGKNVTRSLSNSGQRRGDIIKQPCSKCGSSNDLHKHHEDYSDPARVMWLCSSCHEAEHDDIRRGDKPEPALPPMTEKVRYTH